MNTWRRILLLSAVTFLATVISSHALPIAYNVTGTYSTEGVDLQTTGTITIDDTLYDTGGAAVYEIVGFDLRIGDSGYYRNNAATGLIQWATGDNWILEYAFLFGTGYDGYHTFDSPDYYPDFWRVHSLAEYSFCDPVTALPTSLNFIGTALVEWDQAGSYDLTLTAAPVPEPSTILLLGCGALGLFVRQARRRKP